MAQLSDDCFAGAERLITTSEALDILAARISPVTDEESVYLRSAIGRILAEDVTSSVDVPPHDNSAVDGYAVNFDDLVAEASTTLPVAGRARLGILWVGRPPRGSHPHFYRRADAGRPDTVLMQEDCVEEAGSVTIPLGIKRGPIVVPREKTSRPGVSS